MVTVYSKNNCVQCNLSKKVLDESGVAYTEINVEEDLTAFDHVKNNLGYLQVPVIVIDSAHPSLGGESWSGFRPDLLEKL